ncbi:hypothetical protein F5Y04DRAFT_9037 [Hypomontagnella monticulosa]|nr:hypothetical protein F5Y04DRAFT_9037 [Hypomontagnella monticulosa]
MSADSQTQTQVNVQSPKSQGLVGGRSLPRPALKSTIPSKRSDDDDVQFISSQPVKKRKTSEQRPQPAAQHQNVLATPVAPKSPVAIPPPEFKDSERRVSTGMVGLPPSDFNAMELTSILRGVSLPVLEKFVLNQPPRKSRPMSPPELSPKQLPRTVVSTMPGINGNESGPVAPESQTLSMPYMTFCEGSAARERSVPGPITPSSVEDQCCVHKPSVNRGGSSPPMLTDPVKEANSKASSMLPPPLPRAEVSAPDTPTSSSTTATWSDMTKQPCQLCVKMRQQANLVKAQGLPMLHHNMSHLIPQLACHPPYGQHVHPHMIAMGSNNVQAFGSGFAPFMMPMNGNNFAVIPTHMTSPVEVKQHDNESNSQPNTEKPSNQFQLSPAPTTRDIGSSASSNPVKPPASLIQPTYRKPSPNLIVDVAETCQEKFPFEEVAKRHNVPVEKVFDVFAAIIQVPLLRCPTDRRRAGKLATTRVKEYAKTKKAIQESVGQGSSNPNEEIVVKPSDIANRLGQVDFPEGFTLRGSR